MKKKFIRILVCLIITIVVFLGLVVVESHLVAPNGESKMFLAKEDIDKNVIITEGNFETYFESYTGDNKFKLTNAITDPNEVYNKQLTNGLLQNAVLSQDNLSDINNSIKNIKDPVECSVSIAEVGNAVGGTIRQGDKVNIYVIASDTKQVIYKLDNVYVNKAFATDGTEIKNENKPSSILNIIISKQDSESLSQNLPNSIVRVEKNK